MKTYGLIAVAASITAACVSPTEPEQFSYSIVSAKGGGCVGMHCESVVFDVAVQNNLPADICIPSYYLNDGLGRFARVEYVDNGGYVYLNHRGVLASGFASNDAEVRESAIRTIPHIRVEKFSRMAKSIEILSDEPVLRGRVVVSVLVEYYICDAVRPTLDFYQDSAGASF